MINENSSSNNNNNNTTTNQNEQQEPSFLTGLTYDQESFLKQQLIKYSVEEEIKLYFTDANFVDRTLFLNFLFSKLTTIPLLTSKAGAKQKFKQLINTLPKIIIQSGVATKKETNAQFRKFVVKCFDIALRTPQEKIKDKTLRIFYDPTVPANPDEVDILSDSSASTTTINSNSTTTTPVRVMGKKKQRTLEDEERDKEEDERKKNPFDIERDETIVKLQGRLTELTQIILSKIENTKPTNDNNNNNNNNKTSTGEGSSNNGVTSLFNIILKTKDMHDLPPDLLEFIQVLIKILALWMEREMRDPKQVQKIKRIYMVTPVKAIKASLNIANPITLLKGIIMLFLAKPFGARNLVQNLCSVLVELGKTDRLTKQLLKQAEADLAPFKSATKKIIINKVKSFVYNIHSINDHTGNHVDITDIPAAITILQYQWEGSPPLDMDTIAQMEEEQFKSLFEYAKMEQRKKEKSDFVDILGNDEMIDIFRELLPVLYEPLGKIFCRANIGTHFEKLAQVLKKIIVVAEIGEFIADDQELEGYDINVDEDEEMKNLKNYNSSEDDNSSISNSSASSNSSIPPINISTTPNLAQNNNTNNNNNNSEKKSFSGWLKSSFNSINKKNQSSSSLNTTPSGTSGEGKLSNSISSPEIFSPEPISAVTPTQSPNQVQYANVNNSNSKPSLTDSIGSNLSNKLSAFSNDINAFINSNPDDKEKRQRNKDIKKKFKRHKHQAISLPERLVLFEEVGTTLMERVYHMIHELVKSDAKNSHDQIQEMKKEKAKNGTLSNSANVILGDDGEIIDFEAGLLSQSVSWLLGILQFLKDEQVDVYNEIFHPLSLPLKQNIINELELVISYRKWRIENGDSEATKSNIEKMEKEQSELVNTSKTDTTTTTTTTTTTDGEEKDKRPPKPVLTYVPTLTTPFISLMTEKFVKIENPTQYSLTNLSSMIGQNGFVMK